jgi:hypothetical protein
VRLRAFGNYAYRIADPKLFHTEISARATLHRGRPGSQLRGWCCRTSATPGQRHAFRPGGQPGEFADAWPRAAPDFAKIGLKLEA